MRKNHASSSTALILGDLLGLLLITLTGFATHGEISAFARMAPTLIPLCIGWGVAAVVLGLYRPEISQDLRQIWRPLVAALLGVPLATWLRGAWLNAPILPIFVLVLTGTVALLMTLWRGAWMLLHRKQVRYG